MLETHTWNGITIPASSYSKPLHSPGNDSVVKQIKAASDMWGPLHNYSPDAGRLSTENMAPIDILQKYSDMQVITAQTNLEAWLQNLQDWIKVVVPWKTSNDVYFRKVSREINHVPFDEVAEASSFNTITSKTSTTTDTVKQKKLGITGTMGVFGDAIFGEDEWRFYLDGLAKCAYITIVIDVLFALVRIGWANKIGKQFGSFTVDHAKVVALAGNDFGVAYYSPMDFWNAIQRVRQSEVTDADTVIVPDRTLAILQLIGASPASYNGSRPTVELKPYYDSRDQQLKIASVEGPPTYWSIGNIDFFEARPIIVNSQETTKSIKPLISTVVVGQMYECNPENDVNDPITPETISPNMNDFYIYEQTTLGDKMKKIKFVDVIDKLPQFDANTGELSHTHLSFVRALNEDLKNNKSNGIPAKWKYLQHYGNGNSGVNSPKDEEFDNNNPMPESINQKRTLLDEEGWRDMEWTVTYNPSVGDNGTYFQPKRIGDLNLGALPNKYISQWAKALEMKFALNHGYSIESTLAKLGTILNAIDNAEYDDNYVNGLIRANLSRAVDVKRTGADRGTFTLRYTSMDEYELRKEREEIYGKDSFQDVRDWYPNQFGGMDLPMDTEGIPYSQSYPPGFSSAGGLYTLRSARSRNNDDISFSTAKKNASDIITEIENIITFMDEFIGNNTDTIDKRYNSPWFVKVSRLQSLIDHVYGTKAPIFLAVPEPILPIDELQEEEKKEKTKGVDVDDKVLLMISTGSNFSEINTEFQTAAEVFYTMKKTENIFPQIISKPFIVYMILSDYGVTTGDIILTNDNITKIDNLNPLSKQQFYEIVLSLSRYNIHGNKDFTIEQVNNARQVIYNMILLSQTEFEGTIKSLSTNDKNAKTSLAGLSKQKPNISTINKNIFNMLLLIVQKPLDAKKKSDTPKTFYYGPKSVTMSPAEYKQFENDVVDGKTLSLNDLRIYFTNLKGDDLKAISSKVNKPAKSMDLFYSNRSKSSTYSFATDKIPEAYLRTSLTASENLLSYINENTGIGFILPANPGTGYKTPTKPGSKNYRDLFMEHTFMSVNKTNENIFKTHLETLPGAHAIVSQILSKNAQNMDDSSDDNFKEKKSGGRDASLDVFSNLFSSGGGGTSGSKSIKTRFGDQYESSRRPSEFDPYEHASKKKFIPKFDKRGDVTIETESELVKEYPGPWESRLKARREISNIGRAALFQAIIHKHFDKDACKKPTLVGQKICNIGVCRTAIEHEMASAIIMKRGVETAEVVWGRVFVVPSIDGISNKITVSATFTHGLIRNNKDKVTILPYCIPSSFIGGMKSDFITSKNQFFSLSNRENRPSLLAISFSVTEKDHEFPVHLANYPIVNSPDIRMNAPHMRKVSSMPFLSFWLSTPTSTNTAQLIQLAANLNTKVNFYRSNAFTLLLHKGPVVYWNPHQKIFNIFTPGTGPRGATEMNIPPAYKTWNSTSYSFPSRDSLPILT